MSETAVERQLRELAHCSYCTDGYAAENLPCVICDGRQPSADTRAIDAGREAIALLRVLLTLGELDYGDMSLFYTDEPEHPVTRAAALLARCEGE